MQTKFKIVETENYILAVSDEEIKEGDWVYNRGIETFLQVKNIWIDKIDFLNSNLETFKVVAYQPKGNAPELDLPLLPEMVVEPRGFDEFEYTEEDLRKAYNKGFSEGDIKGTCSMVYKHESFEEYIQFLKQSKTTPKWFVAEIEEQRTATYGGVIVKGLKTTTNSEGKQVLVGTYLFE